MILQEIVQLGEQFFLNKPLNNAVENLKKYLSREKDKIQELAVLGFQNEHIPFLNALSESFPELTIRSINIPQENYLWRRYTGPEQTQLDYPFSHIILIAHPDGFRKLIRFVRFMVGYETKIILPFSKTDKIEVDKEYTLDLEPLVRTKIGLFGPNHGSGLLSRQLMPLFEGLDIMFDHTAKEAHHDVRFTRSISPENLCKGVVGTRGQLIPADKVDDYYISLLKLYPTYDRWFFIHCFVSLEKLVEQTPPDIDYIYLIRDPRAVVNTTYHRVMHDNMELDFGHLKKMSKEELLSFIIDGWEYLRKDYFLRYPSVSDMVRNSLFAYESKSPNLNYIKYEDAMVSPQETYRNLLKNIRFGENGFTAVSDVALQNAIDAGSFEKISGGKRKKGENNVGIIKDGYGTITLRKGVLRDWENIFTTPIKNKIKDLIGDELIRLGYEKDHDW